MNDLLGTCTYIECIRKILSHSICVSSSSPGPGSFVVASLVHATIQARTRLLRLSRIYIHMPSATYKHPKRSRALSGPPRSANASLIPMCLPRCAKEYEGCQATLVCGWGGCASERYHVLEESAYCRWRSHPSGVRAVSGGFVGLAMFVFCVVVFGWVYD
jgi:hypothetical protein